jgi:alcohol dehydrogenase class IV
MGATGVVANINLPRILRVGAGASKTLAATLSELGLSRPLLVTDSFMVHTGYSAAVQQQLDEAKFAHG